MFQLHDCSRIEEKVNNHLERAAMDTIKEPEITKFEFEKALLEFDKQKAHRILNEFTQQRDKLEFIDNVVVKALTNIGEAWETGDAALSQVYMSGRICEDLIDTILPPSSPDRVSQPNMAIVTFADFHALGRRIVYSILRASGHELDDLGNGVGIDKIVSVVKSKDIQVLLISVLMYPSALKIKQLKEELIKNGLTPTIIVGGAPFNFDTNLYSQVGADYYGRTASDAVSIVSQLIGRRKND